MAPRNPAKLSREEPQLVRPERTINKGTVQDLLKGATLKLADAEREANSGATRLEAAYDAILLAALAVFAAQGLRVTSQAGHHQVALEGLAAELRLSQVLVDEISQLREIRNRKYTGLAHVSPADMKTALAMAKRILSEVGVWLAAHHPNLLKL